MKENAIIAAFMGYFNWEDTNYGKYHESWDWLMPVVEKIEGIDHVIVDIFKEATKVKYYKDDIQEWTTTQWDSENKITHVYKSVVEFIKYFKP